MNPSKNGHLALTVFISWTKLSHLSPFRHPCDIISLYLYVFISGRREYFSFLLYVQHSDNTIPKQ